MMIDIIRPTYFGRLLDMSDTHLTAPTRFVEVDGDKFGNLDLVERLEIGVALAALNPVTLYGGGAQGYIDYPTLADSSVR